jgi:PleD family two-component response regulator
MVVSLRNQWHGFVRCDKEELKGSLLENLAKLAHALTSHASIAGLQTISQIASAFEALLIELTEDPQGINASTHRTMAHAVDCLINLLETGPTKAPATQLAGVALAVDDEMTSLWAVCSALEMAQIRPIALDGPDIALAVLKHNRFDLIFLDVEMPGKTGYDVCKELRTYSTNKTTPVVFVTGLSDFSSRAKSTLSGGNDFIAKPFLLSELAVKTLIHIHKSREAAAAKK